MSVIDKIKLDGTTYDVGKTPDTTLAVSGFPADAAKVGTELDKKVDKVTGKGLSTEDYTTVEKTKLAGLTQIEVDDTLSVEGRAADAKVVGDEIKGINSDLDVLIETKSETFIAVGGSHSGTELVYAVGYIDTTGTYHGSNGYSCSDYIVLGTNPVIYSHIVGYPSISSIAFYAEDYSFISGISAETNYGNIIGEQIIPQNAYYVRFTIPTANASGYIDFTSSQRFSTRELEEAKVVINNNIDMVFDKIEKSYKVLISEISGEDVKNGFIDATGVYNSSSSWIVTGYISCKETIKISERVRGYTTVPNAVYYDKYKVFVGHETPSENNKTQNIELSVPSNAYYVRLNMVVVDTTQYYEYTINELKRSAIQINNAFDPLYGKKIGAVGDSITIGTYSAPNMTYVNQIANAHDMTVDNQAIWGSVFPTGKSDGSGNAKGSIYAQLANVSSDCDMLVISGGINDADYQADDSYWGAISGGYTATLDTTTFCGAFEATLRDALNIFKGKPILFVFEHRMTMKYSSEYGTHFEDVQYALMIEMLKKWGIPYVDLFYDMPSIKFTDGYIALYSFDDKGVHPNATGYRKFYVPRVESKLIDLAK